MRAKIHTSGFFIDASKSFGTGMDSPVGGWRDEFQVLDGKLVIDTKNGRYHFGCIQHDNWVIVPPQVGGYEGPANGLGCIYGCTLNVSAVWDIESSLASSLMTAAQYQAARVAAGLEPVESYPFPKWVPPYAGHVIGDYIEVDEFTEMDSTAAEGEIVPVD